jgi:hypothetical protein
LCEGGGMEGAPQDSTPVASPPLHGLTNDVSG